MVKQNLESPNFFVRSFFSTLRNTNSPRPYSDYEDENGWLSKQRQFARTTIPQTVYVVLRDTPPAGKTIAERFSPRNGK
jgi:hypothetical protein